MDLKRLVTIAIAFMTFTTGFSQLKKDIEYSGFFDTYYRRGPVFFTGGIGTGMYFGDLCGGLDCNKLRPDFSLGATYKIWPKVTLGTEVGFLLMGADDAVASRNFSYSGTNIELNAFGRYYLREDIVRRHSQLSQKKKKFKPYILTGLTGLFFFPKTVDADGNEITDGSGLPVTLAIPIGFGADIHISDRLTVGPEVAYKITFSDRIDNVAESFGNPSSNDPYAIVGIRIAYSPFVKHTKKRKLTEEEVQRIQESIDLGGAGDSTNTNDPATTDDLDSGDEEYPEDSDLLQIEEETYEEEGDGSFDSIEDYLNSDPAEEGTTEEEEPIEEEEDSSSDEDWGDDSSGGDDWVDW